MVHINAPAAHQLTTYSFTCSYLLHSSILYIHRFFLRSCSSHSHSFLLLGFSWNHTEMERERNKQASPFITILVAALLSQNLLIPVIATSVEDQKNYYSPDPHAGRPPSGLFLLSLSLSNTFNIARTHTHNLDAWATHFVWWVTPVILYSFLGKSQLLHALLVFLCTSYTHFNKNQPRSLKPTVLWDFFLTVISTVFWETKLFYY